MRLMKGRSTRKMRRKLLSAASSVSQMQQNDSFYIAIAFPYLLPQSNACTVRLI